jgi:hypothetical protein
MAGPIMNESFWFFFPKKNKKRFLKKARKNFRSVPSHGR